jgi:hypothetical protein
VNTIPGVTFRPIQQWPGRRTPWSERRTTYQFKAGWSSTQELLERELRLLDARTVVLQLDLPERKIRRDGLPYAHARPGHPGVILSFESRHGPLSFANDTYHDWEINLRTIALTLEALRSVDRYGATKGGQQYTGWQAISPPAPPAEPMTVEQAARFIAEQHPLADPDRVRQILQDEGGARERCYRIAARRLHPDAGGSHEAFTRLQEAKRILDEHGGGGARP